MFKTKKVENSTKRLSFEDLANEELNVVDLNTLRGAKGTCHDEDDKILRDAGWYDQF